LEAIIPGQINACLQNAHSLVGWSAANKKEKFQKRPLPRTNFESWENKAEVGECAQGSEEIQQGDLRLDR